MAAYEIDTLVRLAASFVATGSGLPADPTGIVLYVKPPGGAIVQYTYAAAQVVKDSSGNYHYDLLVNLTGAWSYKWQGTGAAQVTSADTTLTVNQTIFSPPL